jgi:hypothetical protein
MASPRRTSRSSRRSGHRHFGNTDPDIFKEGREFYRLLKKEFRNVGYDAKTGRGWANIGAGGRLEFFTSGGDPAVIVQLHPKSFKARPEDAMQTTLALNRIYARL